MKKELINTEPQIEQPFDFHWNTRFHFTDTTA